MGHVPAAATAPRAAPRQRGLKAPAGARARRFRPARPGMERPLMHSTSRMLPLWAAVAASAAAWVGPSGGAAEPVEPVPAWLGPKPAPPEVTELAPPAGYKAPAGLPVVTFADDAVLKQWACICPAARGMGAQFAAALDKSPPDAAAAKLLEKLKPLPADLIVKDCYPDFTDAIDLKALGGSRPGQRSCFAAVLEVDGPKLLRVCHGITAMSASASMWIAGRQVAHGQLVRLAKGLYPVVIETFHGQRGTWLGWTYSWMAARLTEVTPQEVDEVYRWRLGQWETSVAAARADRDALLAKVKFDGKTVRGKEGFFRVGRSVNGKWWLIDPNGRAFYHMGCTGLNAGGQGGRRTGLSPVPAETAAGWVAYLRQWGFNAMGSWTTPEFFDKHMPYADIVDGGYLKPGSLFYRFPDIFDGAWRAAYEDKVSKMCPPNRDNRMCIGYFLENETGFMEMLGPEQKIVANCPAYRTAGALPEDRLLLPAEPRLNARGLGLLQYCLSLPDDRAACKKAWEFLLARHGGKIANVARSWGVKLADRGDVRKLSANDVVLCSNGYMADHWDFLRLWAEEYFRFCVDTIRKYDPNHMILGMRWGGTPHPVLLDVEARHVDVASRNCYNAAYNDTYTEFHRLSGRPVLNGEYSVTTDSFTLVRDPIEPPGGYLPDQRQAVRAREAMDWAFANDGLVGLTKYRWHGGGDHLWSGRPNMHSVELVGGHNFRAAYVAVQWDRPPIAHHDTPIHGQVFISLPAAMVHVAKLPAYLPDANDSLRIGHGPLRIGLVCRQGKWDKTVYGDGIRGEVLAAEGDPPAAGKPAGNDKVRLTVSIRKVPTLTVWQSGTGQYTIDLKRDGDKFDGTMKGTWTARDTAGPAFGYLFRSAPTVRY